MPGDGHSGQEQPAHGEAGSDDASRACDELAWLYRLLQMDVAANPAPSSVKDDGLGN
jgi:hypothetical protein